MFYILQNESTAARRRVPILLTDAATGTTAQTGVATTTIFPYVNINGNAFIGGTGNVGEAGFGQYYYEFEVNEVATLGLAGIHITAAGCRDYDAIAQIAAFDLYSASAGGGISAYDVWQYPIPLSGQSAEDTLGNAANASSSAESQATTAANQTVNISDQVWATDLSSYVGTNYAGDYLLQLGTGATGYASVGLTAGDVWDYASRTITGGIADTVQLVATPVEISYPSMAGLANTIWSTDISGYTSPSAGFDLSNASSGSGISAADVWNYTLTSSSQSADATLGNADDQATNAATNTNSPTLEANVWSYATRTITGGIADTVTTLTNKSGFAITGGTVDTVTNAVNVSTASMAGIANTVWSTLTAPYTTHATFGHQILRSDNAATIGEVTLHQSGGSKRVDADVHAFVNNTASATAMLNILTGIGASMTTNITGNLSGSIGSVTNPVSIDTASMSGIANTVWATDVSGYASPSAGFDLSNATAGGGITAGDVWSYATRTLTSGGSGISAFDVWNFVLSDANTAEVDLVQAAAGSGLTVGDVWNAPTRTITGGTITTNNDKTGYELSGAGVSAVQSGLSTLTQAQVGTEVDASLADVGLTTTVTGRIDATITSRLASSSYTAPPTTAAIASSVWSEPTRTITGGTITTNSDKTGYSLSGSQTFNLTGNITGNLSGSVGSVTSDVNVSTSSMTGIAGTVWGYATRTLTSGAGASAGDVWTYATRTLTSGAGITVNAATNIINGPYFVKSNVDGQDGTLDVIRGMVQDIQLTVTDAFQNPFDVTALGLAVNFYDQAGTLVTSYGTSSLYAPAGLVQFTLDTAVTANEGRYNLILSAAGSGNTIKFGPLQTLVRPF